MAGSPGNTPESRTSNQQDTTKSGDAGKNVKQNEADQSKVSETTGSAEVQVAEDQGISEGEVKQLRYEAGLDQLPGHEANVHAWEASEGGKKFLEDEGDRQKAIEEEAKSFDDQSDQDGLDEGAAKYQEVLGKSKK